MNINEASQVTAISKDMIRYYEKIGLIKPVRKTNGYRDFSEDDLNTLVVIRTLSNSHIPLKQIRTAFQTDSVNSLLAGLSAELESIHKIQRQIKAREQAVQFEIDHMQQYAELRNPVLCHYPERWIVSKTSRIDFSFGQDCQRIVESGDYFQYVARYNVDFLQYPADAKLQEQGILLYNEFPGATHIPSQDSLRFIATHEAGRMLNNGELTAYAQQAREHSDLNRFQLLAYQFFRCMGQKEECVVCVEILLGSKDKKAGRPNELKSDSFT